MHLVALYMTKALIKLILSQFVFLGLDSGIVRVVCFLCGEISLFWWGW